MQSSLPPVSHIMFWSVDSRTIKARCDHTQVEVLQLSSQTTEQGTSQELCKLLILHCHFLVWCTSLNLTTITLGQLHDCPSDSESVHWLVLKLKHHITKLRMVMQKQDKKPVRMMYGINWTPTPHHATPSPPHPPIIFVGRGTTDPFPAFSLGSCWDLTLV